MSTHHTQRKKWDVDRLLEGLIGEQVRVAAKSFAPPPPPGTATLRFAPVRDLFLPDNTQPAGLPVFFEGRLLEFERQIGVVFVRLDSPCSSPEMPEGIVWFRGKSAVILRGPAVVELACPVQVERLPSDPDNYWRDLRAPRVQFEFAFPVDERGPGNGPRPASVPAVPNDFGRLRRGH
ncbi:MAG: hypothetical protein HZA90_13250 [Verrucomicrobia bacterium]|nr:hypothetical protein [Verrucomicrobiota bacterium]